MRVAILGGGFAGLAVTWFVLHYTQGAATIDLYDPEPIGGGPSGLSSGLLHPFAGKQAHFSWRGDRGMKETHRLITEASRAINQPLILSKGILRPAITDQQITDFQTTAQNHEDVEWWDKSRCEKTIPGLLLPAEGGGLYIKNGLTLNVKSYLQGLWQTCARLGTQYHQQAKVKTSELERYDRVLIAIGPMSKSLPLLKDIPLTAVKGQILHLKWPEKIPPLPFSLISQKYIVMDSDQKSCHVGATFERDYDSPHPDREKAIQEIMPKITSYFPSLANAEILSCRAAFRASSYNHLPLVGKISDKLYFFTGLGSKGLLYHAWVGKRMARTLLTKDERHLPEELHYQIPQSS